MSRHTTCRCALMEAPEPGRVLVVRLSARAAFVVYVCADVHRLALEPGLKGCTRDIPHEFPPAHGEGFVSHCLPEMHPASGAFGAYIQGITPLRLSSRSLIPAPQTSGLTHTCQVPRTPLPDILHGSFEETRWPSTSEEPP